MLPPSFTLPEALCRQFSLSEIKSATNDFSVDLIIGKGSFGNVYKATIATGSGNTTIVAVKRRKSDSKQGSKEFSTEVNLLPALRHSHLISLIGYCVDQDAKEMIIVYEYMANGTLADHLYKNNENSSFLSWEQRLVICIGVGRGLEYLHSGTGINQIVIHRDLKSSNILLGADWEAKISDFGLCKRCSGNRPYSPIIASVKGTKAYIDPIYRTTHELSTKTDVYAFGVVLLEVLCGRQSLDLEVTHREKRLVLWAQQCFSEGVVHRIIDPGLRGRIADDGLDIFLDIAFKCLQDRPNKRPTMVEVVARLEYALESQYTKYSSSSSSDDDEYVKIYFGQVSYSSSSANSDVDPLDYAPAVETSVGKSDTIKQDDDSESNITTAVRRFVRLKSSLNNALDAPADLQRNQAKAEFSIRSAIATTSETSVSLSNDKDDLYEKLVQRMNPPTVNVDNESCENATVIKVNSTSTPGVLLELVQVLTDFDLVITKASRTSDGSWFMDVFNVIDQEGNKVTDMTKIQNIREVLGVYSSSTAPMGRDCEEGSILDNHTRIELIGNDRPGLLSEISAILTDLQCNVVSAELWTHNSRSAAVMHLSDEETKSDTIEPEKVSRLEKRLMMVLKGGNNNREARFTVSHGCARFHRRLNEMMFADRNNEKQVTLIDKQRPKLDIVNYEGYSVVTIRYKNRPEILFDVLCTLNELIYFVSHGKVIAEGPEAYMEFWIKDIDGSPVESDAERQRMIQHLEAAAGIRVSEGLKIELRAKDRAGLLSDVTRIIRENSLTMTRAQITTTGEKAVFGFYLNDNLGYPVDPDIIDYIGKQIGHNILQVKPKHQDSYKPPQHSPNKSTFMDFLTSFRGWISFSQNQAE